jgi:hypothetical protein
MILRRIGPLSLAKISGILYAIIGLVAGFFFAAMAFIMAAVGSNFDGGGGAFPGILIGVVTIFAAPILYGLMGFLAGLVSAVLYNLLAGVIGGVEVEFGEQNTTPAQG